MSHSDLDSLYRQVILDHYKHPRNRGEFEDNTITAELNNPSCGDRILLQIKLDGDVIEDVKFMGEGCSISIASASMMTQAIKGKTMKEALEMSEEFSRMMLGQEIDIELFGIDDIIALQGVSNFPARIDCATLAWKAVERVHKNEQE